MNSGIYAYPWDLLDEGPDAAARTIRLLGFDAVHLALAHHAGRFLLPHNPRRRVHFAEDGAIYFRPSGTWPGTIQPRSSAFVTNAVDPLAVIAQALAREGIALVAWLVCRHNTFLGERHPAATTRNAFGDPYPHSLSAASPDVVTYLVALVREIAARGPAAIELEAVGPAAFRHGFHHEIDGVAVDPLMDRLLALSFTHDELALARTAGIDADRVRAAVAEALVARWSEGPAADGALERLAADPSRRIPTSKPTSGVSWARRSISSPHWPRPPATSTLRRRSGSSPADSRTPS